MNKILQVICYYKPAWGFGGPPKIFYEIAKFLSINKFKIDVCTTDAFDKKNRIKKAISKENKLTIYYFKNISNFFAYYLKIFLPIGLKKFLKKNIVNYKYVLISDFRAMPNVYAYKLCRKFNIPYILFGFGSLPKSGKYILKVIFDFLWGKEMIQNAEYLIAQTINERKEYLKFNTSEEKIKLITLSINLKKYKDLPIRGSFRKKYDIDRKKNIIIFLGRINKYKINELYIDCFKKIYEYDKTSFLVIAGRDDGYEMKLKKYIEKMKLQNNILFPGPLYNHSKLEAFIDSDIFMILPVHQEETSAASLEGMACGLPVIINGNCEVPYLEKYNAGLYLSEDKNIVDIYKKIIQNKTKMKNNARKLIAEKYDEKKILKEYLSILS